MIDWSCTNSNFWGLEHFSAVEDLQKSAFDQVQAGHPGLLLGGEFHTVVTVGLRSNPQDILNCEIQPVQTDRGGAATLHSPGQLVIYPILNLKKNKVSVRDFIYEILLISKRTLTYFGVSSRIDLEQVGLWTEHGKIGFCGLRVRNGITQHGLALNLCNDLRLFEQITPCGLSNAQLDRLENHVSVGPQMVFQQWQRIAKNSF